MDEVQKYLYQTLMPQLESAKKNLVGYIGFCWGAWAGARMASLDKQYKIKVGINFHPAFDLESKVGGQFAKVAERIKCAMFVAAAGNDPQTVKPRGDYINILESNVPGRVQAIDYQSEQHGFVIRGDLSNP